MSCIHSDRTQTLANSHARARLTRCTRRETDENRTEAHLDGLPSHEDRHDR